MEKEFTQLIVTVVRSLFHQVLILQKFTLVSCLNTFIFTTPFFLLINIKDFYTQNFTMTLRTNDILVSFNFTCLTYTNIQLSFGMYRVSSLMYP